MLGGGYVDHTKMISCRLINIAEIVKNGKEKVQKWENIKNSEMLALSYGGLCRKDQRIGRGVTEDKI